MVLDQYIGRNNWVREFHDNNPFWNKEQSSCGFDTFKDHKMDVNSESTDNLFVNYVDPSASHSLVILQRAKQDKSHF